LHRVKKPLGFPTAEQKEEALGYKPPKRSAGARIRVWGFDGLDEGFQKLRMRCLEDILVEVGGGSGDC